MVSNWLILLKIPSIHLTVFLFHLSRVFSLFFVTRMISFMNCFVKANWSTVLFVTLILRTNHVIFVLGDWKSYDYLASGSVPLGFCLLAGLSSLLVTWGTLGECRRVQVIFASAAKVSRCVRVQHYKKALCHTLFKWEPGETQTLFLYDIFSANSKK